MFDIDSLNLTEEQLDELQHQLNQRKERQVYQNNLAAIEENRKYIGKCYVDRNDKGKEKYIYILSSKSSNVFRFEAMCFSFPVKFKENLHMYKIFNADSAFSTIEFNGIHVEDYPLLCCAYKKDGNKILNVSQTLTEITPKEYFDKMYEYIDELQTKMINSEFDTTILRKPFEL